MGSNDPLWPIHQRSPRFAKLLDIQERVACLRPEADEAAELVESIAASLKLQYPEGCTEALLYGSLFVLALRRLDAGIWTDNRDAAEALQAYIEKGK
ncbi:MAG: hypothetical protein ACYC2K_01685 [Gemmatimonadales bacterium]